MPQIVFYRALFTAEHENNWRTRFFHSYHYFIPGEWSKMYHETGLRNKENYNVNVFEGVFTENALISFLEKAPKYLKAEAWTDDDLRDSSELAGVCAFDNPKDAYEYGQTTVLGKLGLAKDVVFEGVNLCKAPEDRGYVVRVEKILEENLSAKMFKERYLFS